MTLQMICAKPSDLDAIRYYARQSCMPISHVFVNGALEYIQRQNNDANR